MLLHFGTFFKVHIKFAGKDSDHYQDSCRQRMEVKPFLSLPQAWWTFLLWSLYLQGGGGKSPVRNSSDRSFMPLKKIQLYSIVIKTSLRVVRINPSHSSYSTDAACRHKCISYENIHFRPYLAKLWGCIQKPLLNIISNKTLSQCYSGPFVWVGR